MNALPFWKVQSIGNDFVLVQGEVIRNLGLKPDRITPILSARRFGVGSDGLLVVEAQGDDLSLRMFNPDGSEDFCGNGLRCAVQFAVEVLGFPDHFTVHHLGRAVLAERRFDGRIRTEIGTASYRPIDVPSSVDHEIVREPITLGADVIRISSLSTGSTHTIVERESPPTEEEFQRVSPLLEHHEWFPERTSIMWVWPSGDNALTMRIWERGAGETLGCGTGSTAAAVHAMRMRGHGGTIAVHNPGGTLEISAESFDDLLTLAGFAEITYSGEYPLAKLMEPVALADLGNVAGTTG